MTTTKVISLSLAPIEYAMRCCGPPLVLLHPPVLDGGLPLLLLDVFLVPCIGHVAVDLDEAF
jgi:hypothetical protein